MQNCVKIQQIFLVKSGGMDWVKNLPLETMSEYLAGLIVWWSKLVSVVPDAYLPLAVYVIASVLVLFLWVFVMRILPHRIREVSWIFVAAALFAPSAASGDLGVAPALIGVFHALLMKDFAGMFTDCLPILVTFAVFLVIGAIWKMLRSVAQGAVAKEQEMAHIQKQKQQLSKSKSAD